MKDLVVIGAGGHGRETLWAAKATDQWNILGFVDDDKTTHGQTLCGYSVLGDFDWLGRQDLDQVYAVCGIGKPKLRKQIAERGRAIGLNFSTIVHPTALMADQVGIGEGTVVAAYAIVTPGARIGNHVFINLNCTVSHDTVLEDYVNLAPACNISGNVLLKQGVHFGTNVSVIPGITVGEWTRIGAGSVIIRDIPANTVAVGAPAKVIKQNS